MTGRLRRLFPPALRWPRRAGGGSRGLVLLYHRVADEPTDPLELAVSPRHFGEHLEVLRRLGQPCTLSALVEGLRLGRVPGRAVVVTFDDGYADVLGNASGILADHDVPATAYVTAGSVGSGNPFWWDRLARAVLGPTSLPDTLHLDIRGVKRRWRLGDASDGTAAAVGARTSMHRDLQRLLRPLPGPERIAALDRVVRWAGPEATRPGGPFPLTVPELVTLSDHGLVEIGAHTMSHPVLAGLPHPAQVAEIAGSKARLEDIIGRPITTFAYPYGDHSDYGSFTVDTVRAAGFESACSNFAGLVRAGADAFQIPRFHVSDCDGDALEVRLRAALSD